MNEPTSLPDLSFFAGDSTLDVRGFHVKDPIGALFSVELTVVSPDPDLDLDGLIGEPGRFAIGARRAWAGVVESFEQVRAEPSGLSTYRAHLVPRLWLLTQRRNHRIFQRLTEPDIAMRLLAEWGIPFEPRLDRAAYKKRDYRVQYAESDFAFLSRMLEDAGITYWFEGAGDESVMVLSDAPHTGEVRRPLEFVDDPTGVAATDYATALSVKRRLKPGRYTMRDVDHRLPATHRLLATSNQSSKAIEGALERFHYVPGAFLFEGQGGDTPTADDKLAVRSSELEAERLVQRRLEVSRGEARVYRFRSNALDLQPGHRVSIAGHPKSELGSEQPLLITETSFAGEATGRFTIACEARASDVPYRPALSTPKPKVSGVETAVVVGSPGEEIHTDELGRVRVHFHWDRESQMNDESSCWIPVSQPWAGTGFGGMNLPRVGQEVIVDFLGGDPDRPMITGRVYTTPEPVPYKLPENKTQSGWKSSSTDHTGGYNEIMFEDRAGKELVRIQAERDLHRLVKHDEEDAVLNDRSRTVGRDESVAVGGDRTHQVTGNERIAIGQNQRTFIGVNRATQVGDTDSTIVGKTHVVMVSPPGEQGPEDSGSIFIMDGHKITLKADVIELIARDYIDMRGHKKGIEMQSPAGSTSLSGKDLSISCPTVAIASAGPMSLSAGGPMSIDGAPINLNGGGQKAARMGDLAPGRVAEGSPTVFIGGGPGEKSAALMADPEISFDSFEDAARWGSRNAHQLAEANPGKRYGGAIYRDPSSPTPRYCVTGAKEIQPGESGFKPKPGWEQSGSYGAQGDGDRTISSYSEYNKPDGEGSSMTTTKYRQTDWSYE